MKQRSRRIIQCCIVPLIMVCVFTLHGQQVSTSDQYVWEIPRAGGNRISEPTVAPSSIKQHENLQVSYSTGVANISIPLLELPGGEVNVALSLNYQAGRAIKHNELSNGIGLGWSLGGLGQVTRQINGFPDEWRGDEYNPVVHNVKESHQDIPYHRSVIEANTDAEEDYYTYDFPGYHGAFLVSQTGKIIMLPQSDLVIERESNVSNEHATEAFIIVTPDGKKYRFADKTNINYKENNSPMSLPQYIHDFSNATVSWHLTSITGPDGCDNIDITYRDLGPWSRTEQLRLISDGFSYCLDFTFVGTGGNPEYRPFFERGKCSLTGTSTTKYLQQLVPDKIESRCGSIKLSLRTQYSSVDSPYCIDQMVLYDANGTPVEEVSFDNSKLFLDRRRRLDLITKQSDGVVVDRYGFNYAGTSMQDGYDMFGYKNGKTGANSVLDQNLNLSSNRATNTISLIGGTLNSFTDIRGLETVFEYEPSVINVPVTYESQIFTGDVTVGTRLKSITTRKEGETTGVKRSFTYEHPVCNIDLKSFRKQDFLSYSGCHNESTNGHYTYYMGVCHTPSLHAKGIPLERTQIYYGLVTEDFDNGNIHNTYEYNLEYIKHRNTPGSPYPPKYVSGPTIGPRRENSPFLGDFSNVFGLPNEDRTMLQYHDPYGVIEENFGAEPKIKKVTEYILNSSYPRNEYTPRKVTQYYYCSKNESRVLTGIYAESRNFKYRGVSDSYDILNIRQYYDFASIPIRVNASRIICDSIISTVYFNVDNEEYSRTTRKKFISWVKEQPETDDFIARYPDKYLQEYCFPVGEETYCGDESVKNYHIPAEFSRDNEAYNAAKRGQKRLPTLDKVIFKTLNGSDSVRTHYCYSTFDSNYGPITRLNYFYSTATPYNERGDALLQRDTLFRHIYTQYDQLGRISSMRDDRNNLIKACWSNRYDNIESLEYPEVNLKKLFEYKPLVGCTKSTFPSGKSTSYSYSAGRLQAEYNSYKDLMVSYEYHLEKDGTQAEPLNSFKTTVFDDVCESYQETVYNEKGLPTVVYYPVTASSELRCNMFYDNQDRLTDRLLPVPKDYDTFLDAMNDARCYYDAIYAGTTYLYQDYKTDRSVSVINPHTGFHRATETQQYLCNTNSNPLYQCLRYRLIDNHLNGETVYIDKLYPPGSLDVIKTTDPNGNISLTFTDWRGLKVMERRVVDEDKRIYADTRWLYDARGNVRVIIQPEGSYMMKNIGKSWTLNDDELYESAFVYRYDCRGNCTFSKLPGIEPTECRYDLFNRPYMKANSTMTGSNRYKLTLYDPIGREALKLNCSGNLAPVDAYPEARVTRTVGTTGLCKSQYELTDSWLSDYIVQPSPAMVYYYDTYEGLPGEFTDVLGGDLSAMPDQYARGNLAAVKKAYYGAARPTIDSGSILNGVPYHDNIYTVYEYDTEGRVVRTIENSVMRNTRLITENSFSRQGRLKTQTTSLELGDSIHSITKTFSYDRVGILTGELYSLKSFKTGNELDAMQYRTSISHEYDELGNHVGETVNLTNTSSYKYNLRGQLSEISTPIFHQNIYYEDGGTPCFNGNISQISHAIADGASVSRTFKYDNLNRLSQTLTTDNTDTRYTYSLNSSPLTIERKGIASDGGNGIVDDLTLSYRGNQLIWVEDSADPVILENSMDFATSVAEYEYDSDGRLISDTGRGITNISYYNLDLPYRIDLSNAKIHYCYSADGQKISTKKETVSPFGGNRLNRDVIHYYFGPFELNYTKYSGSGTTNLLRINMPWGYYDGAKAPHFYHKDWQGNIRAITDQSGRLEQATDYYPYGMPMTSSTGSTVNPYKFGAKELETVSALNHYDFHARLLPASIPLFTTPDPKAADYPGMNPYLYCAANPIINIDPSGKKIVIDPNASEGFRTAYHEAYKIMQQYNIDDIATQLISMEETIVLKQVLPDILDRSGNKFDSQTKTLYWNPNEGLVTNSLIPLSPVELLLHEMDHALRYLKEPLEQSRDKRTSDPNYGNIEEKRVIKSTETINSQKIGNTKPNEFSRNDHFGTFIYLKELFPDYETFMDEFYNKYGACTP